MRYSHWASRHRGPERLAFNLQICVPVSSTRRTVEHRVEEEPGTRGKSGDFISNLGSAGSPVEKENTPKRDEAFLGKRLLENTICRVRGFLCLVPRFVSESASDFRPPERHSKSKRTALKWERHV